MIFLSKYLIFIIHHLRGILTDMFCYLIWISFIFSILPRLDIFVYSLQYYKVYIPHDRLLVPFFSPVRCLPSFAPHFLLLFHRPVINRFHLPIPHSRSLARHAPLFRSLAFLTLPFTVFRFSLSRSLFLDFWPPRSPSLALDVFRFFAFSYAYFIPSFSLLRPPSLATFSLSLSPIPSFTHSLYLAPYDLIYN